MTGLCEHSNEPGGSTFEARTKRAKRLSSASELATSSATILTKINEATRF
jgi:hypothetical protein